MIDPQSPGARNVWTTIDMAALILARARETRAADRIDAAAFTAAQAVAAARTLDDLRAALIAQSTTTPPA